jgi:hypothetical protein
MTRLVRLDRTYWPRGGYGHWCPGCNCGHEIDTEAPNGAGARWSFNGDPKSPTFSPSINMKINPKGHPGYQPDVASTVCHYFIRAGRIEFCGDSTHALAGQTVDLPEIPVGKYLTCERL